MGRIIKSPTHITLLLVAFVMTAISAVCTSLFLHKLAPLGVSELYREAAFVAGLSIEAAKFIFPVVAASMFFKGKRSSGVLMSFFSIILIGASILSSFSFMQESVKQDIEKTAKQDYQFKALLSESDMLMRSIESVNEDLNTLKKGRDTMFDYDRVSKAIESIEPVNAAYIRQRDDYSSKKKAIDNEVHNYINNKTQLAAEKMFSIHIFFALILDFVPLISMITLTCLLNSKRKEIEAMLPVKKKAVIKEKVEDIGPVLIDRMPEELISSVDQETFSIVLSEINEGNCKATVRGLYDHAKSLNLGLTQSNARMICNFLKENKYA